MSNSDIGPCLNEVDSWRENFATLFTVHMGDLKEEVMDKNAFMAHMQRKAPPKCPLCGGREMGIEDGVFQLIQFNEGNMMLGGPVIPVVPVTCSNCGNTVLINAIVSGAVKRQQ